MLALIVFVAQLVGAILAFVYREDLDNFVTEGLTRTLDRYGGPGSANASITQSWDFIQENVRLVYNDVKRRFACLMSFIYHNIA